MKEKRYDADTKTLWVALELDSDELVSRDTLDQFRKLLRDEETENGEPLKTVNFVFSNEDAAIYNRQPLAFVGIEAYVGDLDNNDPLHELKDTPDFDTKEDFGI